MKFCRQCAEYIVEHHKKCPNCGYVFPEQPGGKARYYCTRCKRHLLSKICPIHGTGSSIVVESANGTTSSARPQTKSKDSTANSQVKPDIFPPTGKTSPPLSKPSVGQEKKQADTLQPVPLSRPNVYPNNQPTAFFSEQPPPEGKNTAAVLNPIFTKPQDSASASSPANSGNSRHPGPFSSPKESPQAIIEGKLSSPVETQNPDLQPGVQRKNAKKKKTDYRKEEKSARESSTSPVNTIMRGSLKNRVPVWIYWAGSVALLFFAVTALYSFYYPGHVKKSLFDRAEEHFLHGRHEAALQLYREYKLRYPADNTIPEVNKRINQIRENEVEQLQKQVKIYALMQKAAESYNKQHYLKPDDDNAMIYIREILQEDPGFVPAVALQNRIVDFYFEQAEKAFDQDDYDRAVMYYENILAIRPDDTRIQADFDRALKLKYVYGMLDDMSTLADAREEFKNFQEEKSRLKSKIRQERQKLRESSQNLGTKQNATSTKSKTVDKKSVLKAQPVAAGLTSLSK